MIIKILLLPKYYWNIWKKCYQTMKVFLIRINIICTFRYNIKCSLLGFSLGHQQLFNSDKPWVAWTLVLILNYHHCKTYRLN